MKDNNCIIDEMAKDLAKHSFFYNGGCMMNYHNTAKLLYTAGYRNPDWISVEDRLPDSIGKYLVFTLDRRVYLCDFIDHYCDGNMQFDDYRVTHWMPLPMPPKGDEGK